MKRRLHGAPPVPLPHQIEGIEFLRNRSAAALFDEQGLGKSKQLIEAIAQDVEAGALDGTLVICPNSLKATWAEEIERHCSLTYAIFGAGRKARRQAFRSLTARFYIINYEAVASEIAPLGALLRFKRMAVVLDESHRIKTPGARVTRAVHSLRGEAAKRIILTGTPVANTPEDLWSQFYFLDGGTAVGQSFDDYCARFGDANRGFVGLEHLRERLAHIGLRRTKNHALSLPTKSVSRTGVRMSGRQQVLYETLRDELVVWVRSLSGEEIEANAADVLARLVRLTQVASNPRLLDASYSETPAKFAALDRLMAARRGAPAKTIIWSSFVANVAELADRYQDLGAIPLHGELSQDERDDGVARFKKDPSARVLVANPMVAREGLTLTVANLAVYVDRTFNLVDYLQSQDRIHRLSQERACEIVLLLAEDTVDEFIDFSLEQKMRLAQFTQGDAPQVTPDDAALKKPDVLRALLQPVRSAPTTG
jgi:SWI/SNF-related matrix-associated actin-dependent regulator of chromatin subfamily A-like protein 1